MSLFSEEFTILSAKNSTGAGLNCDVAGFDYGVITVNTANSANLTLKFTGAISETAPDVTASQSTTNRFDYIAVTDMQSGSAVVGDTGFTCAGTDDQRIFRVDLTGLKWLNGVVTAHAAGDVTMKVKLFQRCNC